jgi:hypothetical protein
LRTPGGVELDFIPTAIARRFDPAPEPTPEGTDDNTQEGDQK